MEEPLGVENGSKKIKKKKLKVSSLMKIVAKFKNFIKAKVKIEIISDTMLHLSKRAEIMFLIGKKSGRCFQFYPFTLFVYVCAFHPSEMRCIIELCRVGFAECGSASIKNKLVNYHHTEPVK